MSTIQKDGNGISDCACDGSKWHVVYRDTNEYVFHGRHVGQITGKNIIIEHFDTETEMNLRIEELEIIMPLDINDGKSKAKRKRI